MYADVAQLVEHSTRNTGVMGSNPIVGFVIGSWLATGTFFLPTLYLGMWYLRQWREVS